MQYAIHVQWYSAIGLQSESNKQRAPLRKRARSISASLISIVLHDFRLKMCIGRLPPPRPQLSARPNRSSVATRAAEISDERQECQLL